MPHRQGVSLILLPLFQIIGCADAPEQIAPPLLPFAIVSDAGEATATGVAVGGNGDVYLAGDIAAPADFDGDGTADAGRAGEAAVFVARYDAVGRLRWVRS